MDKELLKALRITSAILQVLCEKSKISEDAVYKIEGNVYSIGDVLDSNNELIGKFVDTINFHDFGYFDRLYPHFTP